MWIHKQVKNSVDSVVLVEGNVTHRLFTHSTLVGVSWRLIVVRIWNESCYCSQYSQWINFKVGRMTRQLALAHGNIAVVLLVDINVL